MGKRIIFISTLLFALVFICSSKVYANNNSSDYNFNLEEEIMITDGYTDAVVVSDAIYIFLKSNVFKVVVNNDELVINDIYINHYLQGNILYIISRNSLYILNLKLLSLTKYNIDIMIEDFTCDDYIYIVGNKNNNPCILVLDENGQILKEEVIKGEGFATYKNIEKVNDCFLVTCYKDAFYKCDEFYCVGNVDQMKSLIITIDKTLNIKNIYYFNEEAMIESINSFSVMDSIIVILETDNKDYLYEFDFDLNLILKQDVTNKGYSIYIINNRLNAKLLLYMKDDSFYLSLDNKKIYELEEHLVSFKQVENALIFTYDNKLNIFSEYHVKRIEPLYIDKINYDYSKTSDIKLESFFEKVKISIFKTEPYFRTLISGKFNVTYEMKNSFNSSYFVNRDVIVRDFVNIIDGGVYNTNTKLSFFGDAYLNDEYITNGYVLKEPGIYTLKLCDINGLEKIYTFEVISDYYKDNDNYIIDTDYVLEKGESVLISYDLVNDDILYFIINGKKYYDFTVQNNCVILNITSSDQWGYKKIDISKIVTSNKEIEINKVFTVFTLKDKPMVSINSLKNNENYIISLDIKDLDNSLIDIYYESNNVTNMYMKNSSGTLDSGTFYIKYELGEGIVRTEKLFSLKGESVNYSFEVNENLINIKIQDNSDLDGIIINNENIYLKDTDKTNLIIIGISISLLVIVCCFYICYFFKTRSKHKKINRI